MSNIMGSIGLAQLERFFEMSIKRQNLAKRYDDILSEHPNINMVHQNYDDVVPHIYVVRITELQNRNSLQSKLLESGIQTGFHWQPNHLLSFYSKSNALALPVTNTVFPELLSLPLHSDLTEDDVDFVCKELKGCLL